MRVYKLKSGRYIIAEYDIITGKYIAPMNAEERWLTGKTQYTADSAASLGVHSYASSYGARKWAAREGFEVEKGILEE